MKKEIEILDLTPTGHYADGSPIYSFHTSFPSRNVRELNSPKATKEEAYADGEEYVRKYEQADIMGNMGQVLGVTQKDDGFRAVVNTFHSNT